MSDCKSFGDQRYFFGISTIIIGSFRKHLEKILFIKHQLEGQKINVFSPISGIPVNPEAEFIIFDEDPIEDPKVLQNSIFAKMNHISFVVVANFDGYLGRATIMEMGYAIAKGIDIFTVEALNDIHLSPYCRLLSEIFPEKVYTKPEQAAFREKEDQEEKLAKRSEMLSSYATF